MPLINTAIFLTGLLLLLGIASSKLSARLGMPVLVLFLFLQKYIVSGLTQGAVKG